MKSGEFKTKKTMRACNDAFKLNKEKVIQLIRIIKHDSFDRVNHRTKVKQTCLDQNFVIGVASWHRQQYDAS